VGNALASIYFCASDLSTFDKGLEEAIGVGYSMSLAGPTPD
jgi:hypothetical protein